MSKISKIFAAIAVLVIGAVTLVSCGGYNFYKDWHDAGADISKDNVFEAISLEEAQDKIAKEETFVLITGTSESSTAVSNMSTLQLYADYFDFKGTLYFVDITSYMTKPSDRKTFREALGIRDISNAASGNLIVVCYTKGKVVLDTTNKLTDTSLENFADGDSLNFNALASYIFNDFVFE